MVIRQPRSVVCLLEYSRLANTYKPWEITRNMEKLSQLWLQLWEHLGKFYEKTKLAIISGAAVILATALVVIFSARRKKVKGSFIDISEAKRRIDRENQVKIEAILQDTKRVETHEDILKELNRHNYID